jgi:endoglucanase
MQILSACLKLAILLLFLAALVGCQSPPSAVPATPAKPVPTAEPTPQAPAPTSGPVTVEPVKDQAVLIDQVGYLSTYPKLGLVNDSNTTSFQVVDTKTGRAVFAGKLGDATRDSDSGQVVRRADFSALTQSGTYTLNVPGLGRSPDFRVGDDVYEQLHTDALGSYEQLAVLAPQALWTASVTDRATGQNVPISGGWPDAGDYGRYMPSATGTLASLLLAYDVRPQNATVHELQVLKRELDWMLTMQRPDGGVYHKVTPLNFGGFDKGSDNIGGQLFAFEVSTPDTASFAAVAASASRVFGGVDTEYAGRLLKASTVAWQWLEQHPKAVLPAEIEGTGGYVYSSDGTQRFWAAAELYRATLDTGYLDYVRSYLDAHPPSIEPLIWSNSTTFGVLSVALGPDPGLAAQARAVLTRWADGMALTVGSRTNPWAISISGFRWASNKSALDNAMLLLVADRVAPHDTYVEAALEQLHYVLGRNALAKSYVTGYGFNSVKNPHNRTMFARGALVPGVLVGGPNGNAEDGITPASQGQRSYTDQTQAYASNENSVEYNAPLVFVTAMFG